MLIVGLTGSIGMGKTTVAERFRARGIPVFDADACVHALYESVAAPLIETAFPGATSQGRVDRERLTSLLAAKPAEFTRLEAIIHPLVRKAEGDFLREQARRGAALAVLDIPLLFENGADALVDVVVVASASTETQRARALARPGMTEDKLDALLARQMPDDEKRAWADFVVDTDGAVADSHTQVDAIVSALAGRPGEAYHQNWARE